MKLPKLQPCVYNICIAFILFSCAKKAIVTGPKEYYLKPEFQSEVSVLNMIANFPTANVAQILNSKMPEVIYEDTNIDDDNYTLKVTKRASFIVEPQAEYIYLIAPLKIEAKARLSAGFIKAEQEGSFELDVKFRLQPGLTPDWHITTSAMPAGFQWITEPKVKLGPFDISVAPFLEKIITKQQEQIAKEIDKRVLTSFDIKPLVEEAWKYVQYPIPVNKAINAWTKIDPIAVYFIPMDGTAENIKFGLGIKAKLETTVGNKPVFENSSLPSLSFGNYSDSLFTINLVSKIGLKEASDIAKEQLAIAPLSFENGKYKININDVDFYGSGKNIVVKALLSGDYNGLLYLYGIPYYDTTTTTIKIKDLNFATDTENKLKQTYSWLFKGYLKKQLTKHLQFPLNNKANGAAETLTNYINNLKIADGIKMNAKIYSVAPDKIQIGEGELIFSVRAKGKLQLLVVIKE